MRIIKILRQASCMTALIMVLAACSAPAQPATPTPTQVPPTPFPTFAFVEPTKPVTFAGADDEAAAPNETLALDPTKVARGLGRYQALNCGNCHGENGAGSDGAPSLLGFALTEDDFITFMRSGGDLGAPHQYSTDRLSNSGSRNLYQYLASLAQSG